MPNKSSIPRINLSLSPKRKQISIVKIDISSICHNSHSTKNIMNKSKNHSEDLSIQSQRSIFERKLNKSNINNLNLIPQVLKYKTSQKLTNKNIKTHIRTKIQNVNNNSCHITNIKGQNNTQLNNQSLSEKGISLVLKKVMTIISKCKLFENNLIKENDQLKTEIDLLRKNLIMKRRHGSI